MNRKRRAFVRRILLGLDMLVLIISYVLSYYLRDRFPFLGLEDLSPFSQYVPFLFITIFIWVPLLRLFKNYAFLQGGHRARLRIFGNLIPVSLVGLASSAMVLFFLRDRVISRTFIVLFAAVSYLLLVSFKLFALGFFHHQGRKKRYHRRSLLVGSRKAVENFQQLEASMPEILVDSVVVPDFISESSRPLNKKERSELTEKVLSYVWNNVIDEVIIAYSDIDFQAISPLITECSRMGISVNVILDTSFMEVRKTEVDSLGPYNILSFQSYDYSPAQRFFKRSMDFFAGLLGSLIFCLLSIIIAPLIKLTSPGPVLFRQIRKGKNGRDFHVYKFRTMYADAEERKKELMEQNEMQGQIFKLKDDPRVTPVGRFLRKTSLDEWPQFINILRGDMSLVGTRPPTAGEFAEYEPHHRRRLSVQPGLTGLWQVSGRNEISDFEEIVKLDTWYIDHWSIWLDIKIVFKTFFVLFSGR